MEKSKKHEQWYFVGGRRYSPDVSMLLCQYTGIFERVSLYQSPSGTFFTVRESTVAELKIDGPAVEILSDNAAHYFMDEHSDGIYTDNYFRIFGELEQG